jgi:hypothetical protein
MTKVVGVIPVRRESTRLPRKALRLIPGHSMLEWIYRRARQCRSFSRLLVATDSEEASAHCRDLAVPVMMTSSKHRSGTERISDARFHLLRGHGAHRGFGKLQTVNSTQCAFLEQLSLEKGFWATRSLANCPGFNYLQNSDFLSRKSQKSHFGPFAGRHGL